MTISIDIRQVLQRAGLTLNPMQEAMLRTATDVADGKRLLLLSPTGSGKTLAYLLPMLELLRTDVKTVQAVVVVPTRELAMQGEDMLSRLKTGVKCVSLYGGRPTMEEHRRLREICPQVVFATPGRLNDHLDKENVNARGVRLLVIDEYDKCLEMGFRDEVLRIVEKLQDADRLWLTSATRSEDVQHLKPRILDFLDKDGAEEANRMHIFAVTSPQRDKLETLGRLLSVLQGASCIVFVNHRESVVRVGDFLREKGFAAQAYHGGMEQDKRERALYKFRNGSANVLVATDIAARGLDIPEVGAVIHYHLPPDETACTHRVGRSTRWDTSGEAYFLLGPDETLPEYIGDAEPLDVENASIRATLPKMATLYIGRGKKDKVSKADVLGFLCKKGGVKGADLGRIDVADYYALVAVRRDRIKNLVQRVAGEKIKGQKTIYVEC